MKFLLILAVVVYVDAHGKFWLPRVIYLKSKAPYFTKTGFKHGFKISSAMPVGPDGGIGSTTVIGGSESEPGTAIEPAPIESLGFSSAAIAPASMFESPVTMFDSPESAPAPAPAPSFESIASAPAPVSMFESIPASAPASGFESIASAPAPVSMFESIPASAPASGFESIASAPAPASIIESIAASPPASVVESIVSPPASIFESDNMAPIFGSTSYVPGSSDPAVVKFPSEFEIPLGSAEASSAEGAAASMTRLDSISSRGAEIGSSHLAGSIIHHGHYNHDYFNTHGFKHGYYYKPGIKKSYVIRRFFRVPPKFYRYPGKFPFKFQKHY